MQSSHTTSTLTSPDVSHASLLAVNREQLDLVTDLTGMGLILLGLVIVLYFKNRELKSAAGGTAALNQQYSALHDDEECLSANSGHKQVEMLEVEDEQVAKLGSSDPFDASMGFFAKLQTMRTISSCSTLHIGAAGVSGDIADYLSDESSS